jgi:hypothetical protein
MAVGMGVQIPVRHQRRKCLCAADHPTVKSCGWGYLPLAGECRHARPVRSTSRMASRCSGHRRGGHGRPGGWMIRHDEAGDGCPGVSDSSDQYRRRRGRFGPHNDRW